jgi:hypothetical protein
MPELDPAAEAALPATFSVEIANLSREGQAQVIEAINQAQASGTLDDAQAQHSLAAAQSADDHRNAVTDLQQREAEAVAAGDHVAAAQHAQEIVYELKEVESAGGAADGELVQAEQDLSHQQQGLADSQAAHELVDMAANQGTAEAAATTLDSAAGFAEASATQTAATDHSHDAVTAADDAGVG